MSHALPAGMGPHPPAWVVRWPGTSGTLGGDLGPIATLQTLSRRTGACVRTADNNRLSYTLTFIVLTWLTLLAAAAYLATRQGQADRAGTVGVG
jgi:hypothetical protein